MTGHHTRTAPDEAALRLTVTDLMPAVREDLVRLVSIPGVAFPGFDQAPLHRSADAVAALLAGCGLEARVVSAGGAPAVIAHRQGPAGAPTVLLYAHHDVQPPGDPDAWTSDPFVAVERDGRLYGRGAADDKAGLLAHVAALRAFDGEPPVGVVVFVEGEEENGSASLPALLELHREELTADVVVIADSSNFDIGVPALTTSLRGIVNLVVEARVLRQAVHSGSFGGAVPDALTVLARLIATLHDNAGDVAVAGLTASEAAPLVWPEERIRAEAGVVDGVALIGSGPVVDRLWTRPALAVLGIDAPATAGAANALTPVARAKLSVRLAPGDSPHRAFEAVRAHLTAHNHWGAELRVEFEGGGAPCAIEARGPAFDAVRTAFRSAWDGVEPVEVGVGGSIPTVAVFQEMFPEAAILVTGVEDPYTGAHGPDESLHLGEFARVCLAEALLLHHLAAGAAR